MKAFELPVAFTTYHVTPLVKYPDDGKCNFDLRQIIVKRKELRDTERLIVWHEFFHALMHELGYDELRDDEGFVSEVSLAVMRVRSEQPWL